MAETEADCSDTSTTPKDMVPYDSIASAEGDGSHVRHNADGSQSVITDGHVTLIIDALGVVSNFTYADGKIISSTMEIPGEQLHTVEVADGKTVKAYKDGTWTITSADESKEIHYGSGTIVHQNAKGQTTEIDTLGYPLVGIPTAMKPNLVYNPTTFAYGDPKDRKKVTQISNAREIISSPTNVVFLPDGKWSSSGGKITHSLHMTSLRLD